MILLLFLGVLGFNGDYCFISNSNWKHLNYTLFSIYCFKWSLYIVTIIFSISSLIKIKNYKISFLEKKQLIKNARNIYIYSIIQLANDLLASIFRISAIYYFIEDDHKCLFDPNINTIIFCVIGIVFPIVFAYLSGLIENLYNLKNIKNDDDNISFNELLPKNIVN